MISNPLRTLLFILLLSCCGYAISGTTQTENSASNEETEKPASSEEDVLTGDIAAGEERYKKSCVNCHGAAGKGVASYPKISGQEISYTVSKLETYRDGIKVGPNSSLMIMMAKPLTDEEIANLAAYLKDATEDGGKSAEDDVSKEDEVLAGDITAGEERYKKSCVNCHLSLIHI